MVLSPAPPWPRPTSRHIRILHRGMVVVDSRRCVRTLETSHPPSYYVPPADVAPGVLRPSRRRSFCEWKGEATYFDVAVGDELLRDVAWAYPRPVAGLRRPCAATSPSMPPRSKPASWTASASSRSPAASTAAGSRPTSQARSRACRAAPSGDREPPPAPLQADLVEPAHQVPLVRRVGRELRVEPPPRRPRRWLPRLRGHGRPHRSGRDAGPLRSARTTVPSGRMVANRPLAAQVDVPGPARSPRRSRATAGSRRAPCGAAFG